MGKNGMKILSHFCHKTFILSDDEAFKKILRKWIEKKSEKVHFGKVWNNTDLNFKKVKCLLKTQYIKIHILV